MNRLLALLLAMLIVPIAGCKSTDYTENYQAATARTATDISMTVLAEKAKLTQTDVDKIGEVAKELESFLDTGSAASLTSGALHDALAARIPPQYASYFEAALAYLGAQNVDVNSNVPHKLKRLTKNALHGVVTACELWEPNPPAP